MVGTSFDERAKERAASLVGADIDGRYRIDRVLAMGGMGAVYLARHLKLRKRVALKVLHPDAEDHPELFMRFEREAQAGAQINHPHVASATDFGEQADGTRYLVLEYVKGTTLRALLDAEAPLAPLRAARIARQIAIALGAIHDKGIVHRDLKPRNVMLAEGEYVKVVDFGLARIDGARISTTDEDAIEDSQRLTGGGMIFGTIDYLAPEAAFGMELVDARADLYALGVMLYEMLAGKHPFEAKTDAELFRLQRMRPPPPFAERAPQVSVPAELEAVVMKLLEKDFDERYQSATELCAALDHAMPDAKHGPGEPPPLSDLPGSSKDSFRPPPVSEKAKPSVPPPLPPAKKIEVATTISKRPNAPPKAALSPYLLLGVGALIAMAGYLAYLALNQGDAARPEPSTSAAAAHASTDPHAVAPHPPANTSSATATARATTAEVSSEPAPLPSASATPSASAEASASATPSSAPSATPAPVDAATVRALAKRLADKDIDGAATLALTEMGKNVGFSAEPRVAEPMRLLLTALARDKHPKRDEVFEAVATKQGSAGPDLLYSLLEGGGKTKAALKASELLRTPAVQALATPALRVAFGLRDAPCPDKMELLEEAVKVGDERALVSMQVVVRGCFKKTTRVDQAVTRLRDRLQSGQ